MSEEKYPAFGKIPRLRREVIVTEKIDGTNGLIAVAADGSVRAGSRNRWLTLESDNFGFARWVSERAELLAGVLGEGHHYGEWFGQGIQRTYGLDHKRFALFDSSRWNEDDLPDDLHVVPVLTVGPFDYAVDTALAVLRENGSVAVPGFDKPEGVVVWHTASRSYFKVLLENDSAPKGAAA
mgnify:CR=1 FL=1